MEDKGNCKLGDFLYVAQKIGEGHKERKSNFWFDFRGNYYLKKYFVTYLTIIGTPETRHP